MQIKIRVDRVSLKESVFRLATITGAAVEVNWRTVPDEHYMVLLGRLQQKRDQEKSQGLGSPLEDRHTAPKRKGPECPFSSRSCSSYTGSIWRVH